jgi:hypothetical protein
MLTPSEIGLLSALSHDLAQRSFGGFSSVEQTSDGIIRLTLEKQLTAGGMYRVHELPESNYRDTCEQIIETIGSATTCGRSRRERAFRP